MAKKIYTILVINLYFAFNLASQEVLNICELQGKNKAEINALYGEPSLQRNDVTSTNKNRNISTYHHATLGKIVFVFIESQLNGIKWLPKTKISINEAAIKKQDIAFLKCLNPDDSWVFQPYSIRWEKQASTEGMMKIKEDNTLEEINIKFLK